MNPRQKMRVVAGWASVLILAGAGGASGEIHVQCSRSRCALPVRKYTTREPVMGATVTSPLTATVSVDQILPASKSALVPLDELDALQAVENGLAVPTVTTVPTSAALSQLGRVTGRNGLGGLSGNPLGGVSSSVGTVVLPSQATDALRGLPGQGSAKVPANIQGLLNSAAVPNPAGTLNLAGGGNPAVVVNPIAGVNPAAAIQAEPQLRRNIRTKTFRGGPDVRLPNGIRLKDYLLTIYETGEATFDGMLWHDGGPYGSRTGSHVTITARAMGATEAYEVGPADGPLFWETTTEGWVTKGKPQRLRLKTPHSPEIRAHFEEINRLEVNLESPTIR
jgi:hypothetical protein